MGLLSSLFGGKKSSSNTTESTNTSTTNYADNRIGAEGGSVVLTGGSTYSPTQVDDNDTTVTNTDNSVRYDTSAEAVRILSDSSERSNKAVLDAITKGQAEALSFVGSANMESLDFARANAEASNRATLALLESSDAAGRNVLTAAQAGLDLGEYSLGLVRQNSADLANYLTGAQIESGKQTKQLLDIIGGIADDAQSQTDAARIGAENTIKEVLSFKEAGDTKVAGDLIKYGALAVGVIAAAFALSKLK